MGRRHATIFASVAGCAHARNWYWAASSTLGRSADRCDELPVAGETVAMGSTMTVDDAMPQLSIVSQPAANATTVELEARNVPIGGSWFAIALTGTLLGGSSRCGGRFVYGSVPLTGTIELAWSATSSQAARIVLVRGNGYGPLVVRTADVSLIAPPARPPQHPPPPPPRQPLPPWSPAAEGLNRSVGGDATSATEAGLPATVWAASAVGAMALLLLLGSSWWWCRRRGHARRKQMSRLAGVTLASAHDVRLEAAQAA